MLGWMEKCEFLILAIAFQERRVQVQVMDTIAKPVYYRGGLRGWSGSPGDLRSAWIGWFAMDRNRYSRVVGRLLTLFAFALALANSASAEWKEKVLYSFQGGTDGATVRSGSVIFD